MKINTKYSEDVLDSVEDPGEWLDVQEKRAVSFEEADLQAGLAPGHWPFHGSSCQCLKCLTELLRSSFNCAQNSWHGSGSPWQRAKDGRIAAWGVGEDTVTLQAAQLFSCRTSEITGSVHELGKLESKEAIWGEVRLQFMDDRDTTVGRAVSVRHLLFCRAWKAWLAAGGSAAGISLARLDAAFYRLLCGFVRGAVAEAMCYRELEKLAERGERFTAIRRAADAEEGLDIDCWLMEAGKWVPVSIKSGATMRLEGLKRYRLQGRIKHTKPQLYAGWESYSEEEWTADSLKIHTAKEVEEA